MNLVTRYWAGSGIPGKAWKVENIVMNPSMRDIARSARERGKEEGEEKMEEIGRRGGGVFTELGIGRKV